MKWIILVSVAIAVASALPEKLGNHARAGRHGRHRQLGRQGRQEAPALYSVPAAEEEVSPDTGYGAPAGEEEQTDYVAPAVEEEVVSEYDELPSNDIDTGYGAPDTDGSTESVEEELPPLEEYDDQATYAGDEQATYQDDQDAAASDESEIADDAAADPLAMLMKSVPGIPGEDYPIYAAAPETEFSCEGQVNGGYYADPDAECQVFHICAANAEGGLAKYSFLCPNGTIFNQEYFICDWWFNVDCAEAEALAAERNGAIAAEREEADARLAEERLAADESADVATYDDEAEPQSSYGVDSDEAASEALPSYAEQPSYSGRRRRF